jgi:NDP-sugar pyrophosphorylase family protein
MSKAVAMIFAAGLGTRLKPWTDNHPKALAPVNGKSLLQRNIEYLQHHGINDVVVNVHHFHDQIIRVLEENNGWGSSFQISNETNELLETGGGLYHARDFFSGYDQVITLNSDILTDLDLRSLVASHKDSSALATLAVMKRSSSRYLLFSDKMRLCGWRDRKTGEEIMKVHGTETEEFAFSGVTVFDKDIFLEIRQGGKFSLRDVFLDLCDSKLITGYDHTGDLFIDVGKPGSCEEAEKYFS